MISKLCTKPSQQRTRQKSRPFSAASYLSLLLPMLGLAACAHKPVDTKFDGRWQYCESTPFEQLMCLNEQDVGKLRELLIRCGSEK